MSRKVLVVDDDSDVRYLLQMLLRNQGYSVTTATNGQEALRCIASEPPDLVLMDVEMPELGGLEALRQLRANPATAHLTVALLTGRKNLTDVAQGHRAGTDFYFSKPFSPNDMMLSVRTILERQPQPANCPSA